MEIDTLIQGNVKDHQFYHDVLTTSGQEELNKSILIGFNYTDGERQNIGPNSLGLTKAKLRM